MSHLAFAVILQWSYVCRSSRLDYFTLHLKHTHTHTQVETKTFSGFKVHLIVILRHIVVQNKASCGAFTLLKKWWTVDESHILRHEAAL